MHRLNDKDSHQRSFQQQYQQQLQQQQSLRAKDNSDNGEIAAAGKTSTPATGGAARAAEGRITDGKLDCWVVKLCRPFANNLCRS